MDFGDLSPCVKKISFLMHRYRWHLGRTCSAPFQYWGVPDVVDYANIPWRNACFYLDGAHGRSRHRGTRVKAPEQFRKHGALRCIAFCCSQRHANFMAEFFIVHCVLDLLLCMPANRSAPRTTSLQHLAEGDIDVIFSVDMFNEGSPRSEDPYLSSCYVQRN